MVSGSVYGAECRRKYSKDPEEGIQRPVDGRIYYITCASVPGNLLDIFHNGMLRQPLFAQAQCMDIIGVAQGRMEALRLAEQILWELYEKTGGFDIRSYFPSEDFVED